RRSRYRTNRTPACGSCRTCGRTERVHRSLEKRTERAFPQLPHALSSFSKGTRSLAASNVFNKGRQGCNEQNTHHAAGPATKTLRQGEGRSIVAIFGIVWPRLQTRDAPHRLSAGQTERRRAGHGRRDVRGHRSGWGGVVYRPTARGVGAAPLSAPTTAEGRNPERRREGSPVVDSVDPRSRGPGGTQTDPGTDLRS